MRKNEKSLGSSIEVVPYQPANWYSETGAKKKLYQLEKKGLPNFYNWRFVTLTIDPLKFKSEQSAYEYVKPRMRYFVRSLKSFLEIDHLQYAWKLEFQENGMPHWHMLINYKKPICVKSLTKIWSYGRIDIKRCKDKNFPYTFKYCSKSIDGLPKWFLEYKRPRLFQSSGIFPADSLQLVNEEKGEEVDNNSSPTETLGERLIRYSKMVQFRGDNKIFRLFNAECNWAQSFMTLIKFPQVEFVNPFKLVVPLVIINSLTT